MVKTHPYMPKADVKLHGESCLSDAELRRWLARHQRAISFSHRWLWSRRKGKWILFLEAPGEKPGGNQVHAAVVPGDNRDLSCVFN